MRHLRCFIAVTEELYFARAAEKLHMEQSPLSRAIKELEEDLGVRLLERTTRRTELTWAGQMMLDEARRVLAALTQARASVKSAANGYRGRLRIAVSDGIAQPRLAALLARCREDEPEVEIRLSETSLSQQIKGLHSDLFDAGFAQSNHMGDGIAATPIWSDPLMVAVPARHPILEHGRIPLHEVLRYPLVLCHPEACEGSWRQIKRVLHSVDTKFTVVDRVPTLDLMTTLAAAGCWPWWSPSLCRCGARGSRAWSRPTAPHAGPMPPTFGRRASRSRPGASSASMTATTCATKDRNTS